MDGVRRAIERLYTGVCTVIEYGSFRDEASKITSQKERVVLANQPCRLSFEKTAPAAQGEQAAAVSQGVKLVLAPEVDVKPGSKIIVEQAGRQFTYAASGQAAVYSSHQEIVLSLWRGWA